MIVRINYQITTYKADNTIDQQWQPGEIADLDLSDLPHLIEVGDVTPLTEDEAKAWQAAQADPAPTIAVKGGKRTASIIPPIAPLDSTEGSETK